MKNLLILFYFLAVLFFGFSSNVAIAASNHDHGDHQTEHVENHHSADHGEVHHDDEHHELAPDSWAVIPFVLLLLMIATGPLFFEHFWHKNYPIISVSLGVLVVAYYLIFLHNHANPVHALAEYVQFIALLSSLYIASGGIMIKVDKEGKAGVNVVLLIIGAIIANIIGTTGASMLLIRPFIRLNKNRIKAYHVVFFIFMVSNLGGSLTPIGDPPLFLGFLKGVPFEWTIIHNFLPWVLAITLLAVIFYFKDKSNKSDYDGPDIQEQYTGKVTIEGKKNFIWLGIVIIAVFIDPKVFSWVPYIPFEAHGVVDKISFVRETIMLAVAYFSYSYASKDVLQKNEFNFEPIREVAFLFVGIFATMMPALQLIGGFASSDAGKELINYNTLYWSTGVLSGVLDNAPTYMNFLTASLSMHGGSIYNSVSVQEYAFGTGIFTGTPTVLELTAISVASVFFGAMTYIGNGPNFMVKAIAEQVGVRMPSFFGYITRFSLVYLLPILILTWVIFFFFGAAA